ncbi:hypothetical protein GGR52DRAFT_423854 [Hypoxylon sp. FL1284]|nr:hypothetical protein GGR52DRAFT_423854 [Hypoxylon sp. FL1284]
MKMLLGCLVFCSLSAVERSCEGACVSLRGSLMLKYRFLQKRRCCVIPPMYSKHPSRGCLAPFSRGRVTLCFYPPVQVLFFPFLAPLPSSQ